MAGSRWNAGGLSHNGISILLYHLGLDALHSALIVLLGLFASQDFMAKYLLIQNCVPRLFLTFFNSLIRDQTKKRELDEIKWLKRDLKPDKECEGRGDIFLLSEIIVNFMCWQVIYRRDPVQFGADLEHIIHFSDF
jgi:hypothetical protein